MSINDKMGGFISAKFIYTRDIIFFQTKNGRTTITPKDDKSFIELDIVKNGINPNSTTMREKQGELSDISVNIYLKSKFEEKIIPFNKCLLLLTTPLGETYIYGTFKFPLSVTKNFVAGDSITTYTGDTLTFSGKQPNTPTLLA